MVEESEAAMVRSVWEIDLAGVGGGLLTLIGGLLLERARARRTNERKQAEFDRASRQALRLVELELHDAEVLTEQAASSGLHPTPSLDVERWHRFRGQLTQVLGSADWRRLTVAYDAIDDLNRTLAARLPSADTNKPETALQSLGSAVAEVWLAVCIPRTSLNSGGGRSGVRAGSCERVLATPNP